MIQLKLLRLGISTGDLLAPSYMARRLAKLFLTPTPRSKSSRFKGPSRPRRETLGFEGDTLPLYRFGSPGAERRVLLCHGWRGRADNFTFLIPRLVECGFEVIAYDGPAHGKSKKRQTNIVQFSRFLRAISDHVGGLHSAVGHSFGASTLIFALHRGLPLRRVVLIAPSSDANENLRSFATFLRLSESQKQLVERELRGLFASDLDAWDLSALASELSLPGLVIHDEDDEIIKVDEGRAVAQRWPGATFDLTRGLGHKEIIKDAAVLRQVVNFVSSADAPKTSEAPEA